MQDIVFYVVAKETRGIVRDSVNANTISAPSIVLGVSVCLKMRLFTECGVSTPYPIDAFNGIADWKWNMNVGFNRTDTIKLTSDPQSITVHSVTDTVFGNSMSFTEFVIPISEMNTQELAALLGNETERVGLNGELIGYDNDGNSVFILQIKDFTVWNRIAGLGEPTALDQEIITRSQAVQMIRDAVSSSAATKQDLLTSANAGTNIFIDENGVISNTYTLPPATTASTGGVALATAAETIAGSNTAKALTPASFKAALSGGIQIIAHSALNAFQSIMDLGTNLSVSLESGKAYKLSAITGNHYISVPAIPVGKYGMDAHLKLFVGETALIHVQDPLILMDALIPNAANDCIIKFRDGEARMYVEDHDVGYVVNVNGGTEGTQLDGSLYFGLSGSTAAYIAFANSLNGSALDMAGAVTNGEKHLVGNGYAETTLTGAVDCGTSKFTVANLSLQNVTVNGGVMTLGDAYIPSGSTVSVSGGGLAVEKVTGNGGVIDLGGITNIVVSRGSTASVSGATIINAYWTANKEGAITVFGNLVLSDCIASGNVVGGTKRDLIASDGVATIHGGYIENTQIDTNGHVVLVGHTSIGEIRARGANNYGSVTITSGAVLDLTGNMNAAPIAPGGGITFASGGATVLVGSDIASSSYSMDNVALPSGAKLTNTNVVDLGGTNVDVSLGTTASASGCVFSGGSALNGGAFNVSRGVLMLTSCVVSGNRASGFGKDIYVFSSGASMNATECTLGQLTVRSSAEVVCSGGSMINTTLADGATCGLAGSVTVGRLLEYATGRGGLVTLASGAIVDLTGNMNAAPIAPGGGITFESGGATVKVGDAAASSSYMMDNVTLPAGAKLTNTAVVDLGGTHINAGSCSFSGCFLSGGSGSKGGAIVCENNAIVSLVDCEFAGGTASTGSVIAITENRPTASATLTNCYCHNNYASNGPTVYAENGKITLNNCVFFANTGAKNISDATAWGSGVIVINGGTFGATRVSNNGKLEFAGNVTLNNVNGSGTVIISSGAIIDLTENTNPTPIAPSGGITISSGGISIIDSAGSTHEFQNVAITGSTINNLGQILGATVSIPASGGAAGPWNIYTTLGSSTVSATAEAQELVIDGGLVRIEEL